jgi:hypothetical protein
MRSTESPKFAWAPFAGAVMVTFGAPLTMSVTSA